MRASNLFAVTAALVLFPLASPAQSTEPTQVKQYVVHSLLLPFGARLVGIDDAGNIVGRITTGSGFVLRNGDTLIEPWKAPIVSDTGVIPHAMNSHGEVVVSFARPQNGLPPPWHADGYIYNIKDRTYRPFGFHQLTRGCDSPTVAYDNSGQMLCGSSIAAIGSPTYGPIGSFDEPVNQAQMSTFACPDKAFATTALGLNNRGQAVGNCLYGVRGGTTGQQLQQILRGFIYDVATKSMKVFDYPGSTHTTANAITDAGVVIGTYVVGSEGGVFAYDGAHFTRLQGTDANAPGKMKSMVADLYFSGAHGEIVGIYASAGHGFIAVPAGQPAPRAAEVLDEQRISHLGNNALNEKPPAKGDDPNFPPGQSYYDGAGVHLGWLSPGGHGPNLTTNLEGVPRYIGFNEQGSWIEANQFVYRWNLAAKSLVFPLTELPRNLQMPAVPTAPAAAQAAPVTPSIPTYGEQGKLTHAPDGNSYLSYIVPTTPPTPMNLKVVRPTNTTPAVLTKAHIGAGDTGSWVYIGEGAQAAIAALMNLDANGQVTWIFMTPAMMRKYLEQ
jgi:hypothetical protein